MQGAGGCKGRVAELVGGGYGDGGVVGGKLLFDGGKVDSDSS